MEVLAAVPVKRFFVAKRRLSDVLSGTARAGLGRDLAAHTLATIAQAGFEPVALAADTEVAEWAESQGWSYLTDEGEGLDEAAAGAVASALRADRPWMVVHADLPLLRPDDIAAAGQWMDKGRSVLAFSSDGGTSLIGGRGQFSFAYGPGSFHRHLARLGDPVVLTRRGLIMDLDDPLDFEAASSLPEGRWLRRYRR